MRGAFHENIYTEPSDPASGQPKANPNRSLPMYDSGQQNRPRDRFELLIAFLKCLSYNVLC